jgi:hypothetical protein
MSYFKITHHSELSFEDNDDMKVLCQKLYDRPFRTYVHLKRKQIKSLKEILRTENKTAVKRIRLKELERETEGLK